jgi:hypothetical protein
MLMCVHMRMLCFENAGKEHDSKHALNVPQQQSHFQQNVIQQN